MNETTYGIIFYNYNYRRIYLYLKKNTKDYHEDYIIKDIELINILKNIPIIYRTNNNNSNHIIFLLSINKYNDLFEKIKENNNINKIDFNKFLSKPFDKTLKHNRLKYYDLINSLNIIKNNYIYRNL